MEGSFDEKVMSGCAVDLNHLIDFIEKMLECDSRVQSPYAVEFVF